MEPQHQFVHWIRPPWMMRQLQLAPYLEALPWMISLKLHWMGRQFIKSLPSDQSSLINYTLSHSLTAKLLPDLSEQLLGCRDKPKYQELLAKRNHAHVNAYFDTASVNSSRPLTLCMLQG